MLVVDHIKLVNRRTLIDTSKVKLELYEHESGNIVLASPVISPGGVVYYVTTPALLEQFNKNEITLQDLFNLSPSNFIEIVQDVEARLYLRFDVDILLVEGDKKFDELR